MIQPSMLGQVPEDIAKQMRETIFGSFGGPSRFDIWLSQTADRMAKPDKAEISDLGSSESTIPPMFREWLRRPHEVLDYLLDHLDVLHAWEFQVGVVDGRVQIVDSLWGHVVEEAEFTPDEMARLTAKYNLDVRSE